MLRTVAVVPLSPSKAPTTAAVACRPSRVSMSRPAEASSHANTSKDTNETQQQQRELDQQQQRQPGSPFSDIGIDELRQQLDVFAAERNWQQFHTPRNLLLALVGEVRTSSVIPAYMYAACWVPLSSLLPKVLCWEMNCICHQCTHTVPVSARLMHMWVSKQQFITAYSAQALMSGALPCHTLLQQLQVLSSSCSTGSKVCTVTAAAFHSTDTQHITCWVAGALPDRMMCVLCADVCLTGWGAVRDLPVARRGGWLCLGPYSFFPLEQHMKGLQLQCVCAPTHTDVCFLIC